MELSMRKTNETYRVIDNNRNWKVTADGIIQNTVVPTAVMVSVEVQVIPETTTTVETAETTEIAAEEPKITIFNEDNMIDIEIMNRIHDLNKKLNKFKEDLYAADYVRKSMLEKGFMEAVTNYMKNGGYKYDNKIMNYQSFISKINDFNAAIDVIKQAKKEIEKIEKELEKYEF